MDIWKSVLYALGGTGFTLFMTAAGAALVFLFRGEIKEGFQKAFLGFAAGVMIAASVWSLLIPAMEQAEEMGQPGWLPAAGGFLIGAVFFLMLDSVIPHLHVGSDKPEGVGAGWKRTTMLITAVTLHNLPEGMAVGLLFALAGRGDTSVTMASAIALAIGIGIQNFPEGAAISLPLKQEGMSNKKAFLYGTLSGVVEPIGGVVTVLLVGTMQQILPWLLSFAAGAMIYVVAEELIPEANRGEHSNVGTMGVMAGFLIMMILDVVLG